jgi:hypothetical protein
MVIRTRAPRAIYKSVIEAYQAFGWYSGVTAAARGKAAVPSMCGGASVSARRSLQRRVTPACPRRTAGMPATGRR